MAENDLHDDTLVELTADIVAAYVAKNATALAALPDLIRDVHTALVGLGSAEEATAAPLAEPAVSIRRSVTPDHIVCLEDGLKFKSLKRHLMTSHEMTPAQYREKWGLKSDYPMVAPNYATARSEMAKSIGLGRKPGGTAKPGRARKKAG